MRWHRAAALGAANISVGIVEGQLIVHHVLPPWLGVTAILASSAGMWWLLNRSARASAPRACEPPPPYRSYEEIERYAGDARRSYAEDQIRAERAHLMLMSLLSLNNQLRLEAKRPLHITGSMGGEYLVHRGHVLNVQGPGGTFCAFAPIPTNNSSLTDYVTMIAQVLMLITDEWKFRAVAVRRPW